MRVLRELKAKVEAETGETLPTGPDEELPPLAIRAKRPSRGSRGSRGSGGGSRGRGGGRGGAEAGPGVEGGGRAGERARRAGNARAELPPRTREDARVARGLRLESDERLVRLDRRDARESRLILRMLIPPRGSAPRPPPASFSPSLTLSFLRDRHRDDGEGDGEGDDGGAREGSRGDLGDESPRVARFPDASAVLAPPVRQPRRPVARPTAARAIPHRRRAVHQERQERVLHRRGARAGRHVPGRAPPRPIRPGVSGRPSAAVENGV